MHGGTLAGPLASTASRAPLPWVALAVFLSVHLAMLAYDFVHPEVFLKTDRAATRLEAIQGLLASPSWSAVLQYLGTHGNPGDYALHALALATVGRYGLILLQTALTLLSAVAVYRIALLLGLSRRVSVAAMCVYLLLPHTLILPHQLSTEPLHVPLLAISTWLVLESVRTGRTGLLVASALLLGVATLIRPITLLWPAVVAVALMRYRDWRGGVAYAALAVAPVLLWMGFVWMQTGELGMGRSNHSLSRNLYLRVEWIADTLPADERRQAQARYLTQGPEGEASPLTYLRFGMEHPLALVRQTGVDAAMFVGKSGIERLSIDYLQADAAARREVQHPRYGWRYRLQTEGVYPTLIYLWDKVGVIVAVSVIGSLAMAALFALALVGAWRLLRPAGPRAPTQALAATLLIALPIYVFAFSQVVPGVQSRHRAPAEFAIVILATLGYGIVRDRLSGRARLRSQATMS